MADEAQGEDLSTRRRLLDAARVCLERAPHGEVSTRELLAQAELSPGTLYKQFRSKEALWAELARELLTVDVDRLDARTAALDGDVAVFVDTISAQVLRVTPASTALATLRATTGDEDAREAVRELNAWITESFLPVAERAVACEAVRSDVDLAALVEMLDLLWDGLGRRSAQESFATSPERIAAVVRLVLTEGLAPPGELNG